MLPDKKTEHQEDQTPKLSQTKDLKCQNYYVTSKNPNKFVSNYPKTLEIYETLLLPRSHTKLPCFV